MIVHACNTSTREAEDFKFEASLGFRERDPVSKKKKRFIKINTRARHGGACL
jgi:hypothetical protein